MRLYSGEVLRMPTAVKIALIFAALLTMYALGILYSTGGPGALIIPGNTPQ